MKNSKGTKDKFIHSQKIHNTLSSEKIVPVLIEMFKPQSVIDIGCGVGNWLTMFEMNGITDVLGIDGTHLDLSNLLIDSSKIKLFDLEKPFHLDRRFDLAISLEVAEHLSQNAADDFIESLTKLSDIIIFSAAIPYQGGQNHINEQWVEYWIQKFEKKGYNCYDVFRSIFWDNCEIHWWYRQNMFLAIKPELENRINGKQTVCNVVHPDLYISKMKVLESINQGKFPLPYYLKLLIKGVLNKIGLYPLKKNRDHQDAISTIN